MGLYRNITDEALLVVVGNGLQRVEVDGVVELPDEQAQQTTENGHPSPQWAPVVATTTKKTGKAAPAADNEE